MKLQLDYSIKDINIRLEVVENICKDHEDELTTYNLEQLSNYLIFQMEKDEKKEKKILTPNRMVTVNKRETSFEGLINKFKDNEDNIYGIIKEDKNVILSPKIGITKEDVETIPFLKQIQESIAKLKALPKKNYIAHQAIINLAQTQYLVKEAYKKTIWPKPSAVRGGYYMLSSNWCDKIDLTKWKTVSALLKYYSKLKTNSEGEIESDMFWMLMDLEDIIEDALAEDYPMLYDILVSKVENSTNLEIQRQLETKYNRTYSIEYISSLFNNKIPKLIANRAEEIELIHHYTFIEKGEWKTCPRCGQNRLLHPRFFSINSSSKNGFYSICKDCRNTKKGAD